jgi:adenine-specific DNA-methyltransferase
MIYMDPPYGVKFGSNFQPFVRKRDVKHGDDEDMTREPEMVQAYRDTWELGLHSYLAYLRDRLLLARDLLSPIGSIFVQISDENLHHVREIMDEVFGAENFIALIPFRKKTMPLGTVFLEQMSDFLLWYAKVAYDGSGKRLAKYNRLYLSRSVEGEFHHCWYELPDGSRQRMSAQQLYDHSLLPPGARVYRLKSLEPSGPMASGMYDYKFEGVVYKHPKNGYGTPPEGMDRLVKARRIQPEGNRLTFIMYADESTATQLTAPWTDTVGADDKRYVVQTNTEVVKRCLLMTSDPGDLVLDPTCGSGTTAYVAEQWGRRWITIDTSRVPLALARQRVLTATFPWFELKDEKRGPSGGFIYRRKQNKKGEEVGGIVPHITLKSIANNEPPAEEVLVDRPEEMSGVTRVSGPFCVEATIPTPVDWDGDGKEDSGAAAPEAYGSFVDRMLEVLRKTPVLRLEGNKTVTFKNVRPPAKTLSLSAEALVTNGGEKPVAFVFGPENGAVSEKLVYEAAREAHAKSYTHLFVIGFAIQPNARPLVDKCADVVGVSATYVQATPDLMMGDLLKNMRSSQIFSVCGMPEVKVHKLKAAPSPRSSPARGEGEKYQVELIGLDVFDPVSMEVEHRTGDDVPAWFLDTDYNDLCFHVCQAFFPRTGAWENLRRALKGRYEESVWEHLSGTMSAPFEAGEHGQIAVKVIDDRGNELLVVKRLKGTAK